MSSPQTWHLRDVMRMSPKGIALRWGLFPLIMKSFPCSLSTNSKRSKKFGVNRNQTTQGYRDQFSMAVELRCG